VVSQQTGHTGRWNEALSCHIGDLPPSVDASIALDRTYRKPVLNSENGYEYLPGRPTYSRQVHHTDNVRRAAWRIVCAGAYYSTGFSGSLAMGDYFNQQEKTDRYTFVVKDAGAGAQHRALYDFFTRLPFWKMQPFHGVVGGNAVALAQPGSVYVVYLAHGGSVELDLKDAAGALKAQWFDPRTGAYAATSAVQGGKTARFESPGSEDWTLLIRNGP
jgi:hypothetical protein